MAASKRNSVRVFSRWEFELEPTSPRRARFLIQAGVAKPYKPYDGDEFAIKLVTETRNEALKEAKERTAEGKVVPCWKCGAPVPMVSPSRRQWCPSCWEERQTERAKELEQYLRLRASLMHDRALRILERQEFPVVISEYKEASEVVLERAMTDPQVFDSAHEMVAVMELLRQRVHVKLHPEIGKYKPDIMLPEEKAIVEIDGFMHKYKHIEDRQRDIDIRKILGPDWETVRIPTEYVEQNIKQLLNAIRSIKREMQKARKANNGLLPEYFSGREKIAWGKTRRKLQKK